MLKARLMLQLMDYKATKQMWKLTPFIEEVQLLVNQDLLHMIRIR